MPRGGHRPGAGRPKGKGKYGEETKPLRLPVSMTDSILKFVKNKGYRIPLFSSRVSAGFPSPADDHLAQKLDLNEHLIKHPNATFFLRVAGESMKDAGIFDGDILVVDKSLTPSSGKIIVAAINGELTVKRFFRNGKQVILAPENKNYQPLTLREEEDLIIWGVVTNVIHKV
ncbi:MAG: DNA polymerase V [Zetaproteobacteria bacterium]|nr:DNA polymerase V [Pseudobdellovibrionaceae bacterium]|tara:strand:- start:213 stop:728 length:516 start_codon:yes stop_codon:yes gene_type:complete